MRGLKRPVVSSSAAGSGVACWVPSVRFPVSVRRERSSTTGGAFLVEHAGRHGGGARHARRHGHRRRGRRRPQRLRPAHDPDRLGYRHAHDGSGRPERARVRDRRRGQGDRDRAGHLLPGLDLQRPGAGPDAARQRGRAAAHPLRRTPARTRTRMHFHGIHAARMDGVPGRRGEIAAGRGVRLRVRRQALRLPPLPLPRRCR